MNTGDLFDYAVLDAFGILDEEESAAFEAAFSSASPALQAQLRAEQTRFTQYEGLLPDADASPDLRAKVLARLSAMREAEAAHRDSGRDAEVRGPVRHAPGRRMPWIPGSSRVSAVWRASSIGFATAAVVLGAATVHFQGNYRDLRQRLANDELVHGFVREGGASIARGVLFDAQTQAVRFALVDGADDRYAGAQATLFVHPEWEENWFVCRSLPSQDGVSYQLVRLNEAGEPDEVLAELNPSGPLYSSTVRAAAGERLAVAAVSREGGRLVSSIVLVTA